jgi:hypothetical protein
VLLCAYICSYLLLLMVSIRLVVLFNIKVCQNVCTVQYSTPHTQSLQYSTVGVGLVLVLVSTSSIIAETAHPVRNSGFIVFSPTTYVVYELADGEKPE